MAHVQSKPGIITILHLYEHFASIVLLISFVLVFSVIKRFPSSPELRQIIIPPYSHQFVFANLYFATSLIAPQKFL